MILPKMSGCVMGFQKKGGDKTINSNLISLRKDNDNILKVCKTV